MNKGSEWRKWDLHIHTPFSTLNNGFGNNWDEYVKQLFQKAIQNNICAVGITDYFTIDGYKKIKTEYLNNPSKMHELFLEDEINKINKILILPNIEFRLKKLVGPNRINFHVIFSDELAINDIEENFLHELDFIYESAPQSEDEKRKLKIRNIEELGKKLKDQHEQFRSKSDLHIGMMNAVIDDEQIIKILINKSSLFKDKYFIALPCDEDLSKVSWNSQDHHARKLLIQKSDILLATNPKTVEWAVGKYNDSVEDYINEFKSLKPCIGGSDAHNYDELFVKNREKNVWIKSDVTFEGLRQIKFEPSQRIVLSTDEPYVKDHKFIIEEVKFISSEKKFTDKSFYFNDNLNVIIGGKSSGKSILLYNIARTLFQDNIENSLLKHYNPDTRKEEYKYEFDQNFDFIVKLKSGATQSVKRTASEASILTGIKYIPQNYLSELAERKFKKSNELNKLVRDLILEDHDSDREYEYFKSKVKKNDNLRETLINNYFNIISNISSLKHKLISIGNKGAINQNINNIEKEVTKLKREAGFTEEENIRYDRLKSDNYNLEIEKSNIIEIWRKIRDFNSEMTSNIEELISRKNLLVDSIQHDEIKSYYESKYNLLNELLSHLKETEKDFIVNEKQQLVNDSIFRIKLLNVQERINQNNETLKPFYSKVEIKTKIDSLEESLSVEAKKLNDIVNIENEIDLKQSALEAEFDKIFALYESNYKEYIDVILKLENRINTLEDENLQIKGIVKYNFNKFREYFIGISNSTTKSFEPYEIFKLDNSSSLNFSQILEEKKELFNLIVNSNYVLRKQTTPVQAIKMLLDDYYYDYWEVSSNQDTLYKMSTGKASFIILKLIIGLSKSKAPILIDQPEDNLDNRSITKELVDYLKNKKIERQIILVTHNPNIVVNADAENIIVAHQYGQNANEEIFDFQFDYINGALENTFKQVESTQNILESMGIREHIAEIVEGGKEAFKLREQKYRFN